MDTYLMLAALLLVAAGGLWLVNRHRRTADRPCQHLRIDLMVHVLGTVAFAGLAIGQMGGAIRHPEAVTIGRIVHLLVAAGGTALFALRVYSLQSVIRGLREVTEPRPPGFVWQGTLILLPLALLVSLGFWSIRRDYAWADEEAARRAREAASLLTDVVAQRLALEFSDFELKAAAWSGSGVIGGLWVPWPGRSPISEEARARQQVELKRWAEAFPGMSPQQCFPTEVILAENRALRSPVEYSWIPEPAAWLEQLTPEQRQAWIRARAKEGTGAEVNQVRRAYEAFLELQPSPEAQTNALYAMLNLGLAGVEPQASWQDYLSFAASTGRVASESGLPVNHLALSQALAGARTAGVGLTEESFGRLRQCVLSDPSILTERLLDLASAASIAQSQAVRQAVADLTDRWQAQQRLRGLVGALRRVVRLAGHPTTNVWLSHEGQRWFCMVHPGESLLRTHTNGQDLTITNAVTRLRFIPKDAVSSMVRRAVGPPDALFPSYLGLRFWLEDEGFTQLGGSAMMGAAREVPWGGSRTSGESGSSPRRLAEGRGLLSLSGAVTYEGETAKRSRSFETFPSQPRFQLALELASPALLYDTARKRAWLMGVFLVAAAITSGIGLYLAARAFHQQRELAEARSNLVSSVSHELRTPIASVRLLAESLERGRVVDPAKQAEYFRLMGRESRRLGALIENVLSFSRWEQGRARYEFEPTDVARLVRETIEVIAPYALEREVHLAMNIFPDPTIETAALQGVLDGRLVQQALVNLLDNAIKHSPPGATVTTRLTTNNLSPSASPNSTEPVSDGWIELSVEDEGPGIPHEEQERIFDPFYRLGSELRRETSGVGIGLTLVRATAEAHGGSVTVDSHPGRGSRFTIRLPKSGPGKTQHPRSERN